MARAITIRTRFSAEPGNQSVTMTSTFDAPVEKVYRAYVNRELVPKWWGPEKYTTTVDKMDVRPGGEWRFIQRDEQGKEFAFRGVYHDVVENKMIISTFEWEEMRGHVILDTITFKDVGGKTEVTDLSVFQSIEDRDGMYKSGMEEGGRESNERFAILVEKR